jgi:hypothetical protein
VFETLPCLWNFWLHLGKKYIFQQFLPLMRSRPYKVALPNRRCIIESWQISCRYVYIFRKSNSINPIHQNVQKFFWTKVEQSLCKIDFHENAFTKGMLDFAPQKLIANFSPSFKFKICEKFKISQAKMTKLMVANYFWLAYFNFFTEFKCKIR